MDAIQTLSISTVDDLQNYLNSLYGPINKDRDINDIYGYLSRTSGYLTRSVIKNNFNEMDIIRPLSWLFALATKLDIKVQDSFLKKYPTICPYCISEICCCFKTNKRPKDINLQAYKIKQEQKKHYERIQWGNFSAYKLSWAIENISNIYPNNAVIWHFSGPWMACSKLFEEVAELHEAIDKFYLGEKIKENVEEEIADVFAWLISIWIGINKEKINLDELIINYFYNNCPVCKAIPCKCKFGDARIQGLVDIEKFEDLKKLFENLEKLSPNSNVKELIISLEEAHRTQSESIAKAAIIEAETTIEKITKGLSVTDGTTKKINSIVKNVMSILSYLS